MGMLLTDHRGQSVLSACDKKGRGCQHNDRNNQNLIADSREGEKDIKKGVDHAKQQHKSAIPHTKGAPHVANKSESKRQVERDCGHEPETGNLMRTQLQLVFQKKADRNIDQASGRTAERN
jgi:hypothetical protein